MLVSECQTLSKICRCLHELLRISGVDPFVASLMRAVRAFVRCVALSVVEGVGLFRAVVRLAWRLVCRAHLGRDIALVQPVELRLERVARPTLRAIVARQPPGKPASSSGPELAAGDRRRTGALLRRGRRLLRGHSTSTVLEASARGAGLPAQRGVGTTPPTRSDRRLRGRARPRHGRAASGCRVAGRVRVVAVIRGRCA
jgi:hypothetical protein